MKQFWSETFEILSRFHIAPAQKTLYIADTKTTGFTLTGLSIMFGCYFRTAIGLS